MITDKRYVAAAGNGSGYFARDSMIWQVNREMILLLAGGRALLMQLAHPKIAAGVAAHSHFKDDPLSRLYRTMSAMWSIIFDETATARVALERIKNVHSRVRGEVGRDEPLPLGTPYDALDVDLLLWVHATLIDSALAAYDLFVQSLTTIDKSCYYRDSTRLASLFEIPEHQVPAALADFEAYMTFMIGSGTVAVGATARSLSRDILYPRPWILRPGGPLFRLVTAGLLPMQIRQGYGLRWDERKQQQLQLWASAIRCLVPLAPKIVRIAPNARAAEKRSRNEASSE